MPWPLLYFPVTVNGISAIMRARLIAVPTLRWCVAQLPLMRRGMTLPRSVMKYFSVCGSL